MNLPSIVQSTQPQATLLPQLSRLYSNIEMRKAAFLRYLDPLTDAERRQSPAVSEWSPLEVMEHLIMVEEWVADDFDINAPGNGKVSLKGYLFMLLAGNVMRRFQVPSLSLLHPNANLDFDSLKERWDATRSAILAKLARVTEQSQNLPIALHPVAGPLNAAQFIELLDIHLIYHTRKLPHAK